MVTEFGQRFDGHPDLESVDVAFIGPWGEGDGECSDEAIESMTEVYATAHSHTPLLSMVGGLKMAAGVRRGFGWRCDCFGDLGFWKAPDVPADIQWNHHYNVYPQAVHDCAARDAWQTAPVVFESGSVPMRWYTEQFDIDFILRQGRKLHGSVFMPKSCPLPPEWMDMLASFCNDLGYRFVFRQLESVGSATRASIQRGTPYTCEMWIENVGVAPIYRCYSFALKFQQEQKSYTHLIDADIRQWLPGDIIVRDAIALPDVFGPGRVRVSAGLIDKASGVPRVRFANEDADASGWLPLDEVDLA